MSRTVEFAGTTTVVTGGASGIGKGMAEAFLAAGAHVVVADIDQAALAATAAELGVLGVPVDVADPDSAPRARRAGRRRVRRGARDSNNAGVGRSAPWPR